MLSDVPRHQQLPVPERALDLDDPLDRAVAEQRQLLASQLVAWLAHHDTRTYRCANGYTFLIVAPRG